jgi:transcriptional regulator with XRE-family HTH domain
MLGEKLKSLRESKGLLLKDVAKELDVDIAFVSRIERNEKAVNRQHLSTFSALYGVKEDDLLPIWLGQRVIHLFSDDIGAEQAKKALKLVINDLNRTNN